MVLAVLVHGLLLLLPMSIRSPEPRDHGIEVTLRRETAPEPIPIADDVAPLRPPAPYQAAAPRPREAHEPPAAEVEDVPSSRPAPRVVERLSRYRLGDYAEIREPPPTTEPRLLGSAPAGPTLAAVLDSRLPELPFADPDTPFVFFPISLDGDIEKAFSKVTKEFGFKVASAKVRCAWIVVIVACGWK